MREISILFHLTETMWSFYNFLKKFHAVNLKDELELFYTSMKFFIFWKFLLAISSTDALHWLESHGITMLPADNSTIVASALEGGQTIALTGNPF